jgi:hypothetical protein
LRKIPERRNADRLTDRLDADAELRRDVEPRVHDDFRPRQIAANSRAAKLGERLHFRKSLVRRRSSSTGSSPVRYSWTSRPPPLSEKFSCPSGTVCSSGAIFCSHCFWLSLRSVRGTRLM